MQIEIFTCCERTEKRGHSLDIIGATRFLSSSPSTQTLEPFSVVLRAIFQPGEGGGHVFGLQMKDADGLILFSQPKALEVQPFPPEESDLVVLGTFFVDDCRFFAFGDHFLTLLVDEVEHLTTRVFVPRSG